LNKVFNNISNCTFHLFIIMSLYKVLTKTKVVQQELKHTGVGGFVWCEEGFKWIGSGSDRGNKSENERKNADVDLRQTSSDSEKNLICKSTDDGTATNWPSERK